MKARIHIDEVIDIVLKLRRPRPPRAAWAQAARCTPALIDSDVGIQAIGKPDILFLRYDSMWGCPTSLDDND